MPKIVVRGARSPEVRDRVRRAVQFYASKLMSRRMADSLLIRVNIHKKFYACGDTEWMGVDPYRPKQFVINVRDGAVMNVFCTLAHEMVHVKQYATQELRQLIYRGMHRWNGDYYKDSTEDDVDAYYDLPWEIEAFGKERGLYDRFMRESRKLQRRK